MLRQHMFDMLAITPLQATVSTRVSNYSLFSALGSPSGVVEATLTITTDGICYSNSSIAALTISGFAAGSKITVINNGYIIGKMGAGGGSEQDGDPATTPWTMTIGNDIILDNTYGNIFAGGGGGGGGGHSPIVNGGAGGAGAGCASDGTPTPAQPGENRSGGSGKGGKGGGYGLQGAAGGTSVIGAPGGNGGVGGNAIRTNGHTITWLGGNNSTQVKGAVV